MRRRGLYSPLFGERNVRDALSEIAKRSPSYMNRVKAFLGIIFLVIMGIVFLLLTLGAYCHDKNMKDQNK